MAGRLLPIALSVVSGVAIGVATFDGEFKEQRRKQLEDDCKREVTAVSSLNSEGPSPMASSAIKPPAAEKLPSQTETTNTSRISSLLGFWAWKNTGKESSRVKEANGKETTHDQREQS